MKNEITFAIHAIIKNIRSAAELRSSFVLSVIGMMLNNSAFIIIWVALIGTVGTIGGWDAAAIVGLQGFVALSYGILFSFGAGIREMSKKITSGAFDQYLLAPKHVLVRTATSSFNSSALGDIFFGFFCLTAYLFMISAGVQEIGLLFLLAFFSAIAFVGVNIVIQSIGFYFTDPGALTQGFFELFLTPALFHGGAFQGETRFFFTFVVPSLVIGTLPVEGVMDPSFEKVFLIGALAVVWFAFSIWFFHRAVRNYESANFMTFGG